MVLRFQAECKIYTSLSPVSEAGCVSVNTGRPLEKKSMMVANISGFNNFQSTSSSCFVTVMNSCPKKTDLTPSIRNRSFPNGEQ